MSHTARLPALSVAPGPATADQNAQATLDAQVEASCTRVRESLDAMFARTMPAFDRTAASARANQRSAQELARTVRSTSGTQPAVRPQGPIALVRPAPLCPAAPALQAAARAQHAPHVPSVSGVGLVASARKRTLPPGTGSAAGR